MNNYTVYMHISPSGKRYIGITCLKPIKRWGSNGCGYKTQMFYRAIEKYGWDNFQHIIIAKGLDEETAKWLEIELIRKFDTTNSNKGYNVTLGGEGANGWTPNEETRNKMSESHIGERNHNFGKPMSEESKQKNREAHLGKTHSEETIQKLSGKNNHKARKIICITTNEIFDTLTEGAEKYNIDRSGIGRCCKGYRIRNGKKVKCDYWGKHPITNEKLVWKYYDEYLKELEVA